MSKYRKFIVAAVSAALTAAQTALPLTPVQHGWVTVVLAALGAVGVAAIANTETAGQGPRR